MKPRPEVHLRVLVSDDATWVAESDRAAATALARPHGWHPEKLAAELDEGVWASEEQFGWAIIVDGEPGGFALVTSLTGEDPRITLRISPSRRGRGVGREVLRKLADHHFSSNPGLARLTGRAHEHNVPMQRVFNAAGFRMETRFRDSFEQADGNFAAEWGYSLTREDWEAGRHRLDLTGYDLHGLVFVIEETVDGAENEGFDIRFEQQGRAVTARYGADRVTDGELGGVLVGDLLQYRWVHVEEAPEETRQATGRGRARVQRRQGGSLELVDDWTDDNGTHGRRVLVQHTGDA